MAISPASFGSAKRDETGPARTNREIRARTDTRAGTNQRREVPLPHALARLRHAGRAAFRDSVGLIGPAQKHHWAEHLAMPCPARDHECRKRASPEGDLRCGAYSSEGPGRIRFINDGRHFDLSVLGDNDFVSPYCARFRSCGKFLKLGHGKHFLEHNFACLRIP